MFVFTSICMRYEVWMDSHTQKITFCYILNPFKIYIYFVFNRCKITYYLNMEKLM